MKKPIVGILLALFISSAAHGEPALRKVNRLIILYNYQLDIHRQKAAQAKLRDLSPQEKAVLAKFNTAFAGFVGDQDTKVRPYVTALQTEVRKTPRDEKIIDEKATALTNMLQSGLVQQAFFEGFGYNELTEAHRLAIRDALRDMYNSFLDAHVDIKKAAGRGEFNWRFEAKMSLDFSDPNTKIECGERVDGKATITYPDGKGGTKTLECGNEK